MGRFRAFVCALAVALVCAASTGLAGAHTPERTSPSKPPPGYHTVTVKEAGFSIAVPNGWVTLDPTSKAFRDKVERVRKANPRLAETILSPAALEQLKNSKLFVADPAGEAFHRNGNVLLVSDVTSLPTEDDIRGELESGGISEVEARTTRLARRTAVEAAGGAHLNSPDSGTVFFHSTQYWVVGKKGELVITFTALDDARQDSTFQTMIHSLKLVR